MSTQFSPVLLALAFATLVIAITAFGRRLPVPAPVLQVFAGILVALVPGVSMPELDPDIVFFVFLPPILWAAAFFTSLREFKAHRRQIGWLAVGLVLATSVLVAVVARWLIPGLPWAAAVALGAIISPPDAVAAAAVVSRLPVPRRVIAILEGESLVNDASALVLYRTAVAAAVTGTFSLGEAVVRFFLDAGVGVLVGLFVGWCLIRAARRTHDELTEVLLTLAGPYAAWTIAETLHVSAVLACVAGGLYTRQHLSTAVGAKSRLQARAVWDLLVFVLNAMIFTLLGVQFADQVLIMPRSEVWRYMRPGLIITGAIIAIRLLWVPVASYLPSMLSNDPSRRAERPDVRNVFLVGWTSMRGIVSLATAFALPLVVSDGTPFPHRTELVFITMFVILFTLVVQGCTLTPLIRWFNYSPETHMHREVKLARLESARRAAEALEDAAHEPWANTADVAFLRAELIDRVRQCQEANGESATTRQRLRDHMRDAERRMLVRLRDEGAIGDEVLLELERDLDLDAIRGSSNGHAAIQA